MKKIIEKDSWKRLSQYKMFVDFDDPFFSVTNNVKVSNLIDYCRRTGESFFLHSLQIGAMAANSIEEIRTRIQGDEVVLYDKVNYGSTVLHPDKNFSFCYFEYYNNPLENYLNSEKALKNEMANPSFDPKHGQDDIIHFSVMPWISFTSVKHARNYKIKDSIPKIVYGKYFESNQEFEMPINIELHHSLADGYHAALFFDKWEEIEKTYRK